MRRRLASPVTLGKHQARARLVRRGPAAGESRWIEGVVSMLEESSVQAAGLEASRRASRNEQGIGLTSIGRWPVAPM
jgi:hypothetical protein